MAKTYEGLTSEANIVKNEKETSKNTAQRIGGLLVDIIERVGGDVSELTAALENIVSGFDDAIHQLETGKQDKLVSGSNIKTINGKSVLGGGNLPLDDVTVYSGGMINLASASVATSIRDRMAQYEDDDIVLFIVSDSNGQYPSLTGETRVNVDSDLTTESNYFFSADARGANVGDLLFAVKRTILFVPRIVLKIVPLNDAKTAQGGFVGTEGIMTVWDKTQINKISGIENVANSALPKSSALPSRWASNMNEALQTGVYPWCTLGRPAGSTGAYTCIVLRTSTNDGNYDTIEQTAYGREGELGQVYKRIIFYKSDGTDTQYGDWIEISRPLPIIVDGIVFTSIGYEPIALYLNDMEDLLRRPVYVDSVSSGNRCFVALDSYENKVLLSQRVTSSVVRISEITGGLVTRYGFYDYRTQSAVTPSQMTKEEIIEVARVYPQLNIPI